MKHHLCLLAACLAFAMPGVNSAALPKNQVSADAKWLLHLDLQDLRRTHIGEFLHKNILENALGDLKTKIGIDVAALVQKVSHITAYGTDFGKHPEANAVLLVQMDAEAQKILEGFLAAQLLADTKGVAKKEQQGASVLYSVMNGLFVSIEPKHLAIASKDAKLIEKARSVLAGQAPDLKNSTAFSGFPTAPDAFFLMAVAEGFNENAAVPPQAQVLKMADGARIVLGEHAEKLFLNLALKAKTEEVTEQIQQVFEGIRAMFSLSQVENRDLQELVRSIKVSTKNKIVSVNAEFPIDSLLKMISDHVPAKRQDREGKSKSKDEPEAPEQPK